MAVAMVMANSNAVSRIKLESYCFAAARYVHITALFPIVEVVKLNLFFHKVTMTMSTIGVIRGGIR